MALRNNPLMGLFASVVVMSATVAFGIAEISVFGESLDEYVLLVFPLSLASAYMLSDYSTQQMDGWEVVAVIVPIAAMAAMMYIGQVGSIVSEYQPFSGIVLTAVAVVSFYVIMD